MWISATSMNGPHGKGVTPKVQGNQCIALTAQSMSLTLTGGLEGPPRGTVSPHASCCLNFVLILYLHIHLSKNVSGQLPMSSTEQRISKVVISDNI